MPWKTVLRPEDTRSSGPAGYGMSSGRCLGFSTTLWAHGGTSRGPLLAMGSYWLPSLVAITLSSVALWWQHSPGDLSSPLPYSRPGSTAGPTSHSFRAAQALINHLAACTRPLPVGPLSDCLHHMAFNASGPCPSPSLPGPASLTPLILTCHSLLFLIRAPPKRPAPLFNHTPSHPCGVYRLMFIIRLPNTTLSPFLINPPLIPLPSHNGKAAVLEPSRYENTSGPP
jgi:hypothetical protein